MFLESCFCACDKWATNPNGFSYLHSPTRWENGQSIFSRHFPCFLVFFYARENCWQQEEFWFAVAWYFCKFSVITRNSQLTLNLHASTATRHIVLSWRAECVLILQRHLSAVLRIVATTFSVYIHNWICEESSHIFHADSHMRYSIDFFLCVAHFVVVRKRDQWPNPSTHLI